MIRIFACARVRISSDILKASYKIMTANDNHNCMYEVNFYLYFIIHTLDDLAEDVISPCP